jgi:hypothetical protein
MRRNFRLALFLALIGALVPAAAFAKDRDRHDNRGHWADKNKDKSEKHVDHRDRSDWRRDDRDRHNDHDRDDRIVRRADHDRDDRIARVRDREREERERRWREDQRQENLRREREWRRQREWEREHDRMITQRGANHTPAGWSQGKKTGWKNCNVPPGQTKPSGCEAAPVQSLPPQAQRRGNNHDRDDANRTTRVRDSNVRQQPPMSERH